MRLIALASVLVGLTYTTGCDSGWATGSVSGKVTYRGKVLATGTVLLVNVDSGKGAAAEINNSGEYSIPEVPIGSYQVAISPEATPSSDTGARRIDLPAKYLDPKSSGLSVTIEAGENTADFSL